MNDDITQEEIDRWKAFSPRYEKYKNELSRIELPEHPAKITAWIERCNQIAEDGQHVLDFQIDAEGAEFLVFQVIKPETDEQYEARAIHNLRWIKEANAAWEEINNQTLERL